MATTQMRNPISSGNPAGHMLGWQASGTERRAPWSRFRGVVTTPSYNITDIRSFFDQGASTGSPEQHGHPQRLLEYRLALVRNLAHPRPNDVVLDLGCGVGDWLRAFLDHGTTDVVGYDGPWVPSGALRIPPESFHVIDLCS